MDWIQEDLRAEMLDYIERQKVIEEVNQQVETKESEECSQ